MGSSAAFEELLKSWLGYAENHLLAECRMMHVTVCKHLGASLQRVCCTAAWAARGVQGVARAHVCVVYCARVSVHAVPLSEHVDPNCVCIYVLWCGCIFIACVAMCACFRVHENPCLHVSAVLWFFLFVSAPNQPADCTPHHRRTGLVLALALR